MMSSLIRPLRCFLLLATLCLYNSVAIAKDANSDIYGTWEIDGLAFEHPNQVSEAHANMAMGMPVLISAKRFFYIGRLCMHTSYRRSHEEKTAYFHGGWRNDASRLPLPKMLTVVATDCGKLYPIHKNRILIEDPSGVFFSAVRVKNSSGTLVERQDLGKVRNP
jgi:hypothetical protein